MKSFAFTKHHAIAKMVVIHVNKNFHIKLTGGNHCYDLQGFQTELIPLVILCCIVRILEECGFETTTEPLGLVLTKQVGDFLVRVFRVSSISHVSVINW